MEKKDNLLVQALGKAGAGILLMGILIFLPAGTFAYPQGWLMIIVLFVPMIIAGFVMLAKAPDLLRKRLTLKEERSDQKKVILFSGILFILVFVISGLVFRAGRSLPFGVSLIAAAVFLCGYLLYAEVLRENAYLSRSVEVQQGQKVIDTGLYGVVRHPMYMATLLLFLSMPLILGSLLAFALMLGYIPIIVLRIRDEEKLLAEELPGYTAYMQKVKYRLIPRIW